MIGLIRQRQSMYVMSSDVIELVSLLLAENEKKKENVSANKRYGHARGAHYIPRPRISTC